MFLSHSLSFSDLPLPLSPRPETAAKWRDKGRKLANKKITDYKKKAYSKAKPDKSRYDQGVQFNVIMGSSEQPPQQPPDDREALAQRSIPWMELGDASSTLTAPPKPFGDDVSPAERAMLRFTVQGNAICR